MSKPLITLEYRRRYWTVCANGNSIATFPSLTDGMRAVPEAVVHWLPESGALSQTERDSLGRLIEEWHTTRRQPHYDIYGDASEMFEAALNPPRRVEPGWALPMCRAELIERVAQLEGHLKALNLVVPTRPTADSDKPKG